MTMILQDDLNENHVELPPHGFVRLEAVGGTDLMVVNAARCSFDQQSRLHHPACNLVIDDGGNECDCPELPFFGYPEQLALTRRDRGLLNMLMRDGHTSPFEQVETWWRFRLPIFVTRQWQRHRMAEMNEESGRYSKLKDEAWHPVLDAVRTQVGKPGSYSFEAMEEEKAKYLQQRIMDQNAASIATYHELLDEGLAKEVARSVLPVSMYSTMVWKVNFHALMHFLLLRNDSHAQREIREFASVMEEMIRPYLPAIMDRFHEKYERGMYDPMYELEDEL